MDDPLLLPPDARDGRSVQDEHREFLRRALRGEVQVSGDEIAARLRVLTAGRRHTPAEVLVRESRDER
jgi:antitoxin FitA